MPIMTSVMCYATGAVWMDLLGELLNGCVQIYLGVLICSENVSVLMGQSMSSEDLRKIQSVLKKKKDLINLEHLKTSYIGSDQLKISASFKYCKSEINQKLL